jgi:signal transduction histidine kinase
METAPADPRIRKLLIGTAWAGLIFGTLIGLFSFPDRLLLGLVASLVAGLWVLALSVTPHHVLVRPLVIDAFALGGAILAVSSMTLTDGITSPYLILSFMPTMVASAWSGLRSGLATAGLTAGLLLAVTLSVEDTLPPSAAIVVLYFVVGATVAQIRRLLRDAEMRAESLEATTVASRRRLEDLEQANRLLSQLAELAAASETSPIDLGRTALDGLQARYPDASMTAAIVGEKGPIVVARTGVPPAEYHDERINLTVSDRVVGYVRISAARPIPAEELEGAAIALEPLALAFSNALLLQELTTNAVKEERTRLARELHDEIGPGLSALGLSLDMAMFQGSEQRELTDHLQQLRKQVGSIIDEVRVTVSDLRSSRSASLRSHLSELSSEAPTPVDLDKLDERRPVRPSLANAVYAICGEALRNAIGHSGATRITVKGWVDFDRGRVVIEDNGKGFDPSHSPPGHFGLIGMRERAVEAGIVLDMQSSPAGSRIVLAWGST